MESLYFLIPLSMVVLAASLIGFFWAVRSGQYDDLDGDAERILFDDEVDADTSRAEHGARDESLTKAQEQAADLGVRREVE